ncbi:MAG: hypothetical protein AAF206_18230 [Bacteroidota bacterium]
MKHHFSFMIENHAQTLTRSERKKLRLEVLLRLVQKLEEAENDEMEAELVQLFEQMPDSPVESESQKTFRAALKQTKRIVRDRLGYVEKGSLRVRHHGLAVVLGMVAGILLGSAMGNVGVGIGIGVCLGLVVSTRIGLAEEKKAQEKGLVY